MDDRAWIRRHPKTTMALAWLVILALADVAVGNLYFRHKNRDREAVVPDADSQAKVLRRSDPVFHHGLASGFSGQARWGPGAYRITTDSLGCKDADCRPVPPKPVGRRILFLGDSFTEGIGVAYAETFVGIIGAALASDHVEALGAGVVSYSPRLCYFKARWLIEQQRVEMDEIDLFVDISDPQDELIYAGFHPEDAPPADLIEGDRPMLLEQPGLHVYDYSLAYNVVATRLLHVRSPLMAPSRLIDADGRCVDDDVYTHRGLWPYRQDLYDAWGALGLERCRFYVQRLAALAAEHHIRLMVCVYPWPEEILRRNVDSRNRTFWKAQCEVMGIGFVDFYGCFLGSADPAAMVERCYLGADVHWNGEGHRIVAEEWLSRYRGRRPSSAPSP